MALPRLQTKIDTNTFSVRKAGGFFAVAPVLVLEYLGLPTLTDLIIPKLSNTKLFYYFLCQKDNVLKTSHRQFFSCKG